MTSDNDNSDTVKTLYLIDGHAQMFRAYYARTHQRGLTSPTGEPTSAIHVFCSMLLKLITEKRPDYLAMAIDGPAADLERREVFPDYKVTRKPAPEDFPPQADRIIQIVGAMGIPILAVTGQEADDILATAAVRFADDDLRVVLVSRDKDLDQLVTDHVVLYDPGKDLIADAASIEAEKGFRPDQAVEIQTLTGDTTDNIPGVAGIGPKTAVTLIAKYGTADNVIAHADELTGKQRENVLAFAEQLPLTRQLVTLRRDVPLDLTLTNMAFAGIDGEATAPILAELGLNQILSRLDEMGAGGDSHVDVAAVAARSEHTTAADFDYACLETEEALAAVARKLKKVKRLAIDTETTSEHAMRAELVGVSFAWEPGKAYYMPIKGPLGATTVPVEAVQKHLGPILADDTVEKIGQNLKYDRIVLLNAGFELTGDAFDTMVAAHVLDSSRMTYKLDALVADYLGHHCIPIDDIIGRGKNRITMDAAPVDVVAP